MTIREEIKKRSERLKDIANIPPLEASEILVEFTALLSSLNAYISEKHYAVNQEKASLLIEAGSVAKVKVLVEATEKWKEFNDALMQRDAMLEMIKALKYHLRALGDEYKVS